MNNQTFASKDLCADIYEITKWSDTGYSYTSRGLVTVGLVSKMRPAYSLGYLLRKLQTVVTARHKIRLGITQRNFYVTHKGRTKPHFATTPEDAAAKLVIELIKSGTLKISEDR